MALFVSHLLKRMNNQNITKIRRGDRLQLEVASVAFKGKGIAKYQLGENLFTIFLESVVAGDKVVAEVFKVKNRWAMARVIEIIEPSPQRITPKCKHFEECGGCTFQNMSYKDQLSLKKQFVIDSFERIGGFENPPVLEVISSPQEWFYRNKMELSFGDDMERNFSLGFHIPGRRYDIFSLKECFLQSELLSEIVTFVREFAFKNNLSPINSKGEGDLITLTIREGKNTGECMVYLTTTQGPFKWMKELSNCLQTSFVNRITSFHWMEKIAEKGVRTQIIDHHIFGNTNIREKLIIDGHAFEFIVEPQAFFQPNTKGAEFLYVEILKRLGDASNSVVFDLFCGTGTIGIILASKAKKVIGIEINEDAIKSARQNAELNKVENIDFKIGDVAKVLNDLNDKPEIIVLDPPRAGLMPSSIEDIAAIKPKKIIYVSCNPSTLARDCALLKEQGYVLKDIQPVDMFPQTYHVENVVLLEAC